IRRGAEIVNFHEGNSGGAVYATQDRGVITCGQVCDDRGFQLVTGSVAAGLDVTDLIGSDDSTDDCRSPVVIRSNQRSRSVMQFQCRISQCIGNAILREVRAYGANN